MYHFLGPIVKESPRGPFLITSFSKPCEIMLKTRSIRPSKNFLSKYFSRPRKNKKINIKKNAHYLFRKNFKTRKRHQPLSSKKKPRETASKKACLGFEPNPKAHDYRLFKTLI